MDDKTCYCRNPQCALYGRMAPYGRLQFRGWHRNAARFRCQVCTVLVSARTGTAYAGIRTNATTYVRGATAFAEGMSIRAAGRLLSVDKDTVNHWLPVLGEHCQHVMRYFFRHLHALECQLDELWTFIAKKEARLTPLEKLAAIAGDAWVWIAFSPVDKLVLAWIVGKRTLCSARQLISQLQSATDGHIPFFTNDALPHYAEALSDHQHLRRGAQQSDGAPTRATAGTKGERLLQRAGLPGASTFPGLCLLSLRGPPPQFTPTSAPHPSDQRPERLSEEVEAGDARHGSWADRSCVDNG
jgi:IS1 family transposase/transposase-like protein